MATPTITGKEDNTMFLTVFMILVFSYRPEHSELSDTNLGGLRVLKKQHARKHHWYLMAIVNILFIIIKKLMWHLLVIKIFLLP